MAACYRLPIIQGVSLLLGGLVSIAAVAQNQVLVSPYVTEIKVSMVSGCKLNNQRVGAINAGLLDFGKFTHIRAHIDAEAIGTSGMSILCTPGTSVKVTFGFGQHGSNVSNRRMRNSLTNTTLNYQLYTSASRQVVWDNTVGVSLFFDNDIAHSLSVYGRILASNTLPMAGIYEDQVLVTLEY